MFLKSPSHDLIVGSLRICVKPLNSYHQICDETLWVKNNKILSLFKVKSCPFTKNKYNVLLDAVFWERKKENQYFCLIYKFDSSYLPTLHRFLNSCSILKLELKSRTFSYSAWPWTVSKNKLLYSWMTSDLNDCH